MQVENDGKGSGLVVSDVAPGLPAERAGVRAGDQIRAVDGARSIPNTMVRRSSWYSYVVLLHGALCCSWYSCVVLLRDTL